ncbi:uncharacterized protein LOC144355827 [Saccoglossus kowalevskii]
MSDSEEISHENAGAANYVETISLLTIVTAITELKSDLKAKLHVLEDKIDSHKGDICKEWKEDLNQMKGEFQSKIELTQKLVTEVGTKSKDSDSNADVTCLQKEPNPGPPDRGETQPELPKASDRGEPDAIQPFRPPKFKRRKRGKGLKKLCRLIMTGTLNKHNEMVRHFQEYIKKNPRRKRHIQLQKQYNGTIQFDDDDDDDEPQLYSILPFGGGYSKVGDAAGALVNIFSLLQPVVLPAISSLFGHSIVTTVMMIIQGVVMVGNTAITGLMNLNTKRFERTRQEVERDKEQAALKCTPSVGGIPASAVGSMNQLTSEQGCHSWDDGEDNDKLTHLLIEDKDDDDELDDDEDDATNIPSGQANVVTIMTVISFAIHFYLLEHPVCLISTALNNCTSIMPNSTSFS